MRGVRFLGSEKEGESVEGSQPVLPKFHRLYRPPKNRRAPRGMYGSLVLTEALMRDVREPWVDGSLMLYESLGLTQALTPDD